MSHIEYIRHVYHNYKNYVNQICDANDLSTFKIDRRYTEILEHTTHSEGCEYLQLLLNIRKLSIDDIQKIVDKNDLHGSPVKCQHLNHIYGSSSSIRYIYHSHLILSHMNHTCPLDASGKTKVNLVELGGGYGGLCLTLKQLAPLYHIDIESYTIIDMPEIIRLQEMYLNLHNMTEVDYVSADTYGEDIPRDHLFLISNYAFSEIEGEHQEKYMELLFPKVDHGFMCWNFIDVFSLGEYDTRICKEIPQTGKNNKYVYF